MQELTSATKANVTLSLGLLSTTVSLHAAVGDARIDMHDACTNGHPVTRIKQRRFCPVCDNDGSVLPLVKARETGDGLVEIKPEVLESVAAVAAEFSDIALSVHPAEDVSGVLLPSGKSYYLSMKKPGKSQREVYTLLGQLVGSRTDLAFMARYTMRQVTSIFQLVVAGNGTLVMRQMSDAALVRVHPVIEFTDVADTNAVLAESVADALCEPFDPDVHGTTQTSIIEDYVATQTPVAALPTQSGASSNVLDVTAALAAMMEAAKSARNARKAS